MKEKTKSMAKKNKDGIYTLSKIGAFMSTITIKAGLFVARRRWLFYILSYTWGIISTIAGWCCLGFVRLFLKKKIIETGKFFTAHYIIFGKNWGGLECGSNFLVSGSMPDNYTLHTKCHELGHTYQAAVWGPFVIFLFYIPSVIRYWYQVGRDKKGKSNVPYDACYFEYSATKIGETLLSETTNKDYFYYDEKFKKNPNYGKEFN